MIKFTCDKCGHNEYDVETQEIFVFDVVDSIEVTLACAKCGHEEELSR